jgi:glutathione synthase
MSLRVAVQMDPLERINVAGDSTFAIMLGAQRRGHRLFHYLAPDLSYRDGRVTVRARPAEVRDRTDDHYSYGDWQALDLTDDVDVVLMRQDPPFDLGYITATHLLERVQPETLVVNDPAAVRNAPEKLFVLDYARFMPPTLITRSLDETRAFQAEHGEIVVKPLYGNAGNAVFKVGRDGGNLGSLVEMFGHVWVEPFMVQAFLPQVAEGDKRIVLVDGKVSGAINRIPGDGEIRSNLAAGGTAHPTELTGREREICEALGPELARRGLLFVGIDVIGGFLTEINVTSPTGIRAVKNVGGPDIAKLIWDKIEAKRRTT